MDKKPAVPDYRRYEKEKYELWKKCLTADQYEIEFKKLAERCGV